MSYGMNKKGLMFCTDFWSLLINKNVLTLLVHVIEIILNATDRISEFNINTNFVLFKLHET